MKPKLNKWGSSRLLFWKNQSKDHDRQSLFSDEWEPYEGQSPEILQSFSTTENWEEGSFLKNNPPAEIVGVTKAQTHGHNVNEEVSESPTILECSSVSSSALSQSPVQQENTAIDKITIATSRFHDSRRVDAEKPSSEFNSSTPSPPQTPSRPKVSLSKLSPISKIGDSVMPLNASTPHYSPNPVDAEKHSSEVNASTPSPPQTPSRPKSAMTKLSPSSKIGNSVMPLTASNPYYSPKRVDTEKPLSEVNTLTHSPAQTPSRPKVAMTKLSPSSKIGNSVIPLTASTPPPPPPPVQRLTKNSDVSSESASLREIRRGEITKDAGRENNKETSARSMTPTRPSLSSKTSLALGENRCPSSDDDEDSKSDFGSTIDESSRSQRQITCYDPTAGLMTMSSDSSRENTYNGKRSLFQKSDELRSTLSLTKGQSSRQSMLALPVGQSRLSPISALNQVSSTVTQDKPKPFDDSVPFDDTVSNNILSSYYANDSPHRSNGFLKRQSGKNQQGFTNFKDEFGAKSKYIYHAPSDSRARSNEMTSAKAATPSSSSARSLFAMAVETSKVLNESDDINEVNGMVKSVVPSRRILHTAATNTTKTTNETQNLRTMNTAVHRNDYGPKKSVSTRIRMNASFDSNAETESMGSQS